MILVWIWLLYTEENDTYYLYVYKQSRRWEDNIGIVNSNIVEKFSCAFDGMAHPHTCGYLSCRRIMEGVRIGVRNMLPLFD